MISPVSSSLAITSMGLSEPRSTRAFRRIALFWVDRVFFCLEQNSHLQSLGGFSQGGAISIFTGISCHEKLAGIFGLSSYLLLHDKIKDYVKAGASNKDTPIFMGHGQADPLVRWDWGQQTAEILRDMGCKVDFRTYKGLGHSADPKEIDELEAYLRDRLPPLD